MGNFRCMLHRYGQSQTGGLSFVSITAVGECCCTETRAAASPFCWPTQPCSPAPQPHLLAPVVFRFLANLSISYMQVFALKQLLQCELIQMKQRSFMFLPAFLHKVLHSPVYTGATGQIFQQNDNSCIFICS